MRRFISRNLLPIVLLWAPVAFPCLAADQDPAASREPSAPAKDTSAKLQVEDPVYDFGVIRAGEVDMVTHTFKFKNVGTGNLLITKIKPSCGCTSAVASATDIAPGGEATLTAALNPKGKSVTSVTVRVTSNDPTNPSQTFRIKGTVLNPWRVIPMLLDLGDIGKGESKEKISRISSQYFKSDTVHKITALRSSNPAVVATTQEFKLPPSSQPGRKYIDVRRPVNVRVTGEGEIGPRSAKVLVSTDDPKNPTQTLNVRWRVQGDLTLSTRRVIVIKRAGKSRPINLKLGSRGGISFEVLSIETKSKRGDDNPLVFTPLNTNSSTEKTYRIELSDEVQAGKTNLGDIVITTNHPEQKTLTVPYTASVIAARPRVNISK